ncbi:hypothetical protein SAMN05428936_101688 [Pelagibacterium halotolerans]|nr:hypothetical protein SAMN05428936_101688 [Pelagibacterium halotolerans]
MPPAPRFTSPLGGEVDAQRRVRGPFLSRRKPLPGMGQDLAKMVLAENRSGAYLEYVSTGNAGQRRLQPALIHSPNFSSLIASKSEIPPPTRLVV